MHMCVHYISHILIHVHTSCAVDPPLIMGYISPTVGRKQIIYCP